MNLHVKPIAKLKGSIQLPASKSYSIRAFMIAACGGKSEIVAPSNCDDAVVASRVARNFGYSVVKSGGTFRLTPGKASKIKSIKVGESGTVLRFVLPQLPFLNDGIKVEGQGTLIGRPNHHLLTALRNQGMQIAGKGKRESVPIVYRSGNLAGGTIAIDGSLSSQFISALLIAAPRVPGKNRIVITGKEVVSKDYITMTLNILKQAGVRVIRKSPREFVVHGPQTFKGLKKFKVPSDYGLAAFFMSAASILPSDVVLKGFLANDLIQSDGQILRLLKAMGARFEKTGTAIRMKGPFTLNGGTFSLKDAPDLVPIMAVTALFAKGATRLTDIHHARAKESDRISDLRRELLKVGARVSESANALVIEPLAAFKSGVELDPHRDHRLAMAFAVLGLKIGVRIKNIECTHKSYPDFVRDLNALGGKTVRRSR